MKPQNKFLIIFVFSLLFTRVIIPQVSGWQEIGKMKFAVSGGQIINNGSKTNPKFYILGGYSQLLQHNLNKIQIFDPLTKTFDVYPSDMKSARVSFVADRWDSSFVYFGGGLNDTLESFNFYKGETPSEYSENINFNRLNASGAVVADTFFIISGTFPPYDKLPFIVGYDLRKKIVTYNFPSPSLAFSNSGDASVFQADGKIYILGGIINRKASKLIGRFDVAKKEFQFLSNASLSSVRAGTASTYMSSSKKGIVVGGYDETNKALNMAEQMVFNANGTVSLSQLPPLKYARKYPMIACFGNKVYVFGGMDIDNNVVSQIEMYTDSLATKITDSSVPSKFTLEQNYPNPFNPTTNISFNIPKDARVVLKIFNPLGQEIKTLLNQVMSAGLHSVNFDASLLSSGVYFYKIEYQNHVEAKKMLLLK